MASPTTETQEDYILTNDVPAFIAQHPQTMDTK